MIRDHLVNSADQLPALKRMCRAGGRLNLERAVLGPFQIEASRQGQELIVEWSCAYQSQAVGTAQLSLIDCDDRSNAILLAQKLGTSGQRRFPLPGQGPGRLMEKAFVRAECGEKRLYTDSKPFSIA